LSGKGLKRQSLRRNMPS